MNDTLSRESILRRLETVDPLGEIKQRAKELWKQAGSPEGHDWVSYVPQAEQQLLGSSSVELSDKTLGSRDQREDPTTATLIPDELKRELSGSDVAFLSTTFSQALNEHETMCLLEMLLRHEFVFSDGRVLSGVSVETAALAAAVFAHEYGSAYLHKEPYAIPTAERRAYWHKKLSDAHSLDAPLSHADWNTIARLRSRILAASDVENVHALEEKPVLK